MNTNFDPLSWGNRRELLAKRTTYAFSLDIDLALEVPISPNALAPVCWPPGPERRDTRPSPEPSRKDRTGSNIYRVASSGEFVTSSGLRPDVPFARLLHADDQIVLSNRITGSLAGRLLFETDTPDPLRMDYTGVVNFSGWPKVPKPEVVDPKDLESGGGQGFQQTGKPDVAPEKLDFTKVRGNAFVSSRQETGSPKYRWLVHNQLIGVGRIAPSRSGQAIRWSRGEKRRGLGLLLKFSFDFYIGA